MMNKNMLILIKIAILLICTILLIYISNTVAIKIDAVYNHKDVLEKSDNYALKKKDKVYNNISSVNMYHDIMNSVYFYGCAVITTEYPNVDRVIKVYFISDNNTYVIIPKLEYNEQFNLTFKKYLNREDAPPCYSLDFSTINMKDGEYRIFTEVVENEHNYGSFETDIVLDKRNKDIQVDRYYESKREYIENGADVNMQFGIDKLADRKVCTISGYAFFKDNKTLGDKIYVGVKNTNGEEVFYETKNFKRPDVGSFFKNDKLSDSGFTSTVKLSKIDTCELSSIILYKDGKYFKSENKENKIIFLKSDNIIEDNSTLYNIVKNDFAVDNSSISGTIQLPDIKNINKIYIGLKNEKAAEIYYTTNVIQKVENNKEKNDNIEVINTKIYTNDNNSDTKLETKQTLYKINFISNIKTNKVINSEVSSIIIENNGKYYITKIENKRQK